MLHAAAGPVGTGVVPAAPGIGTATAERGAPDVDDARVVGADALDVEPEAVDGAGSEVGGEHVGGRQQPREQVAALGLRQVEADGLLPPVGGLEERVVAVVHVVEAGRDEAPVGIAPHRLLDLHDGGTPLGEQRRGHRDEHVGGDLDDADAVERSGHRSGTSVGRPEPDVVSTAEA